MRLFIAVEIPEEIKKNIYEKMNPLRRQLQGVKWVEQNNLHLTLKFLGEVPSENVNQIRTVLDELIKQNCFNRFEIELKGIGSFPNGRRPRVIWMGISQGADHLVKLSSVLEEPLEELGIHKEERPFSAHLTLGRVKEPRLVKGLEEQAGKFDKTCFAGFSVTVVSCMQSFLSSAGPRYERLFEARLQDSI